MQNVMSVRILMLYRTETP